MSLDTNSKSTIIRKKLRSGATVWVTEKDSPWINGSWLGIIIRASDNGEFYIKPVAGKPKFRIKPSQTYLEKGLFISPGDQVVPSTRKPRKGFQIVIDC